jgi:hypothetical protein
MSYKKKESNYQEKLHEVLSLKRERTAVSHGLDIRHADRLKIFPKFRRFSPQVRTFFISCTLHRFSKFHLLRRLLRGHVPQASCDVCDVGEIETGLVLQIL